MEDNLDFALIGNSLVLPENNNRKKINIILLTISSSSPFDINFIDRWGPIGENESTLYIDENRKGKKPEFFSLNDYSHSNRKCAKIIKDYNDLRQIISIDPKRFQKYYSPQEI